MLLTSKYKPKQNIQDITCLMCRKLSNYANQCQLIGSTIQWCGYWRRYRHTQTECYKKHADEARSEANKDKTKDSLPKTIFKKEVEPGAEENKKPIMFFQEAETQMNEEEVLMKRLANGEAAQKYTRIE